MGRTGEDMKGGEDEIRVECERTHGKHKEV